MQNVHVLWLEGRSGDKSRRISMLPGFTKQEHEFTLALPHFENWAEICAKPLGSSHPVHLLHPLHNILTFLSVSPDQTLRFAGCLVRLDFGCYMWQKITPWLSAAVLPLLKVVALLYTMSNLALLL